VVERGSGLDQPITLARADQCGARDQRLCSAPDVGDTADEQAVALLVCGALDQRRLGIDRDQPHAGIECRTRRPLRCEVQGLAEQHDQIDAPDQIRKRPERGVGDAARALHDHDRCLGRDFQSVDEFASADARQLRTREDDRTFGSRDGLEYGVGNRLRERLHGRAGSRRVRPDDGVTFDPLFEQIGRQAQVNRARPPGRGDLDCLAEIVS
jgi:hypothetical protein